MKWVERGLLVSRAAPLRLSKSTRLCLLRSGRVEQCICLQDNIVAQYILSSTSKQGAISSDFAPISLPASGCSCRAPAWHFDKTGVYWDDLKRVVHQSEAQ